MNLKTFFKKPDNTLEGSDPSTQVKISQVPTADFDCISCGTPLLKHQVKLNFYSCPRCDYYYKISARKRINFLVDEGSFVEFDSDIVSKDPLNFPDYADKLESSRAKSGENEGVICGVAQIDGMSCAVFSMESKFMMGSMGSAVGEKITRLFEYATTHKLPVLGVTVSGGARMQEGMVSLSQMAKVSGAVKRHSMAGGLYIVLLTTPTTGGVTASFAMLGDIHLAEPKALVGFAGPRVIEQTLKQKLPQGFQSAESVLECGFIDKIVERPLQKSTISTILNIHNGGFSHA